MTELLSTDDRPEMTPPVNDSQVGAPSISTPAVPAGASIIIPAYNEETGIAVVLRKMFEVLDGTSEVIVVDDGSSDATTVIASRFPCRLVRHATNLGKGEALKTGVRHATRENVIFIDADASYPIEMIPAMIEVLESCDIVYGSRVKGRENIPFFNRLGGTFFQGLLRHLYGYEASDYCTGLYGMKKRHFESMGISSHGFAIEPEIAAKTSRMKLQMREVPILYQPRLGQTKLNFLKAGLEHMRTILGLLLWRSNHHDVP